MRRVRVLHLFIYIKQKVHKNEHENKELRVCMGAYISKLYNITSTIRKISSSRTPVSNYGLCCWLTGNMGAMFVWHQPCTFICVLENGIFFFAYDNDESIRYHSFQYQIKTSYAYYYCYEWKYSHLWMNAWIYCIKISLIYFEYSCVCVPCIRYIIYIIWMNI